MLRHGLLLLSIALTTAACTAAAEDDTDDGTSALGEQAANEPVSRDRIPDAHAFKGWNDDLTTVSEPKPSNVTKVTVQCADKHLYATHPQSDLKRYHRYARGRYDTSKLTGESSVCQIKGNGRNVRGDVPCLMAAGIDYAMLSDTYVDSCGNFYRGFWDALYLTTEETMGTLMSKGRTVYEIPNAQFRGEVYDGQTYALESSDFVFLSALEPGDEQKLTAAKNLALSSGSHTYDPETHLFTYAGRH